MIIFSTVHEFSFISTRMGKIFGPFGPSNWHSARSTCEGQGRKLLTIDSPEEEDVFAALADPGDRSVTVTGWRRSTPF